jgi:hypothetical protein
MSVTYSVGKYLAEVLDQDFSKSEAKGTPFFYLSLKILGRYDEQAQLQECPRYERTYRQYVAEEVGASILLKHLKTIGVEVTRLTQLAPGTPSHVSLVGRKIDVACELEVYQGKQQERWTIPQRQEKLDLDAVRALDDKFGHLLVKSGDQARPAAVTAPNDSDAAF